MQCQLTGLTLKDPSIDSCPYKNYKKKIHQWITLLTSTYGFVWSIAPLCAALSGFVFTVSVNLIKTQ